MTKSIQEQNFENGLLAWINEAGIDEDQRKSRGSAATMMRGCKLHNDSGIYLSGLGLTSLPPEIGDLPSLRILDLTNNKLQTLPPKIGNLHSLTNLHVEHNLLQILPREIGDLPSLIELHLGYNQLQTLPLEIGKLHSLVYLMLDNNQLQSIPLSMSGLRNLRCLYLKENQLPANFDNIRNYNTLVECLMPDLDRVSAISVFTGLPNRSRFPSDVLTEIIADHLIPYDIDRGKLQKFVEAEREKHEPLLGNVSVLADEQQSFETKDAWEETKNDAPRPPSPTYAQPLVGSKTHDRNGRK